MQEILYCTTCNKHTMKKTCDCTIKTIPVGPARYTPQDRYSSYRRKAKEAERKAKGIL